MVDLSSVSDLVFLVKAQMGSPSEDVKTSAGTCLGHVACGNLGHYLPQLLMHVERGCRWGESGGD